MEEIMVSVLTTAYQHAPFIAQTIESIVGQKTGFRFELIVHDDASTDGTADIIRSYAERYPDIIRPILQTENQYSQGKGPMNFLIPMARGRYIALCEGDDYWCDPYKLQKQVDVLEAHPDYAACVHNTTKRHFLTGEEEPLYADRPAAFAVPFSEICMHGSGAYHTSSLVARAEYYRAKLPDWVFSMGGVVDYPFSIYLALQGTIWYLPETMSVYRIFSPTSWSSRHMSEDEKVEAVKRRAIAMLKKLRQTDGRGHSAEIQEAIRFQLMETYLLYRGKTIPSGKKLNLILEQPWKNKQKIIQDYWQYYFVSKRGGK